MSENTKVTMQVKANGSIRVSGDVDFIDADGNVVKSENGFSLCRCGHSANKPFCDGAHKAAGFEAPPLS